MLATSKKKLTDLETIFGRDPSGRNIYAPEACGRNHTIEAYNVLVNLSLN